MKCSQCNKDKPDVKNVLCPYAYDVEGEFIERDLCDKCYVQLIIKADEELKNEACERRVSN